MKLAQVRLSMDDIRRNVVTRLTSSDQTQTARHACADIADCARTNDNIVRALDVITAPRNKPGYENVGHGQKILVTAAYSDHHDDSHLGPHGQHPGSDAGWAIDFVPQSDPYLQQPDTTIALLKQLISSNYYVTKVGCPGRYANNPTLTRIANDAGVALFTDEGTGPHIHIQSAEDHILSGLAKNR